MKHLEKKAGFFNALSHPVRLKILLFLLKKDKCSCICHLAEHLKRDQSVIFRHIKILELAGILNTRKQAKFLLCCIKDKERITKILEGLP